MGKPQEAPRAPGAGFSFYRITPSGRAAAASDNEQLRCRYLVDLLRLMASSGRSVREHELRQFMPPASLVASIGKLVEMGLIERQ